MRQAQLLQMWRAGILDKGNSVKPDTMLRHLYIGVWKQDSESHTQAQAHQVYYIQSTVISCTVPAGLYRLQLQKSSSLWCFGYIEAYRMSTTVMLVLVSPSNHMQTSRQSNWHSVGAQGVITLLLAATAM